MLNTANRKSPIVWLLLILISITWGSSFILMKKGMEVYSPGQVAALRIFIAFIALQPIWIWLPKGIDYKTHLAPIMVVSVVGSCIPAFLFTIAETKIASSLAGVLNSLTPLFTIALGYFVLGKRIKRIQLLGVLLGFIGAATVIVIRSDGSFETNYAYALLILGAALCYSISANTIKARLNNVPSMAIALIGFSITGPIAGIYLWQTGIVHQITGQPNAWQAMGYVIILGVMGTAYANFAYYYLNQKTSPLFASMVTYLMPIISVLWGVIDHEPLGAVHLASMAVILVGVLLSSK